MRRILVALDGSEHSNRAIDLASDIAGKYGAEVMLLHVMSDKPLTDAERYLAETEYLDDLLSSLDVAGGADARLRAQRVLQHYDAVARRFREAVADRLMREARGRAAAKGVRTVQSLLEGGDPASTILRLAKSLHADVIFLGSRGLGNIQGLLMGSVSHKVMHLAECTCVSVK